MIYPEFLKKNDAVGITAPSDGNQKETDLVRLNNGIEKLRKLSYYVVETKDVRTSQNGRSAGKEQRAEEFLSLIRDETVKVIVSAKGGDFLCEMLSCLDFGEIVKHPKWFQGYSDNTGISFVITTMCDIASLYGNNFNDFGMDCWHESIINNLEILKGNLLEQESFDFYEDGFHNKISGLEGYQKDKTVYWQHSGNADAVLLKGRLIGGCLDVLLNLVGTRFDYVKNYIETYQKDGILWYLESFETNSETLFRSLWQLKEAGWFQHANGIIFGRPCMYQSYAQIPYQKAAEEALQDLNLPLIFDADIGHKGPQLTLVNGAYASIYTSKGKGRLRMEAI